MPAIFKILWLCSVGAIGLRGVLKFAVEDVEAGFAYAAIVMLIILCTFQK